MVSNESRVNGVRAEALAKIFLTRRRDLDVLPVPRSERTEGFDFLVRVLSGNAAGRPEFAVEVKGLRGGRATPSALHRLWKNAAPTAARYLPVVLFVFDVDAERGWWTWLNEPKAGLYDEANARSNGSRGANSIPFPADPFEELNNDAVDDIVRQITAWYATQPGNPNDAPWQAATS